MKIDGPSQTSILFSCTAIRRKEETNQMHRSRDGQLVHGFITQVSLHVELWSLGAVPGLPGENPMICLTGASLSVYLAGLFRVKRDDDAITDEAVHEMMPLRRLLPPGCPQVVISATLDQPPFPLYTSHITSFDFLKAIQ
jgi:hypothetical protein